MSPKFLSRKAPIGIAAAVVLIAGWATFRPDLLFVNKKANDAFPTVSAASAVGDGDRLARDAGGGRVTAPVAKGRFHGVAHQTKGNAAIYEMDGRRVLRLSDFSTSNGPDVRVYLVAAPDATDNAAVRTAGFVEVGHLKANQGNQNYGVPVTLDLNKYRAVTIWCYRFNVNFGTAPLTPSRN